MARVTVEDCLGKVENRFELVLLAAKRARQLAKGQAEPQVPENGDKVTVIALREIAADKVDREVIERVENQGNANMIRVTDPVLEESSEG